MNRGAADAIRDSLLSLSLETISGVNCVLQLREEFLALSI